MAEWYPFDGGQTVGQLGLEGGIILRDEEHMDGARITLERGGRAPFSITCGVYGWMVHTRFFSDESEARTEFESMKVALARILDIIPLVEEADDEKLAAVSDAISNFIERFP